MPYNNPAHGNPHSPPPTKVIAKDKIQDTADEAAQVGDTDNDHQTVIRVMNQVQEVFVHDDATEEPLIIACPMVNLRNSQDYLLYDVNTHQIE